LNNFFHRIKTIVFLINKFKILDFQENLIIFYPSETTIKRHIFEGLIFGLVGHSAALVPNQ